jgi:hypothetical protein
MQSGYLEGFNHVYREGILDAHLFTDMWDSLPSQKNGLKNIMNEDLTKPFKTEHLPKRINKYNLT